MTPSLEAFEKRRPLAYLRQDKRESQAIPVVRTSIVSPLFFAAYFGSMFLRIGDMVEIIAPR